MAGENHSKNCRLVSKFLTCSMFKTPLLTRGLEMSTLKRQYSIPNYLTPRVFNVRLGMRF